MKPQIFRFPACTLALAILLVAALAVLPVQSTLAAPAAQEEAAEPLSLFLGEYVDVNMANGESIEYVLTVSETAVYEFGIVDEEEAIAFDLIITDADGNEIFNDIFGSVELELEPGDYLLRFEAVDNAALEFAVLGNIGDMSADIEAPGELPAGGIYYNDDVSEPLYAILSVPDTPYPQQVTVYFDPGEEDSFYLSAEGDDIGYIDAESDESDLLRFWTHGGDFLISADPYERRSELQIIPFLSGPPVVLPLDEEVGDAIIAGESAVIYHLPLETPYDELTVDVDSASDEIDITLVDRLYDGDYVEPSFGESTLTVSDIAPGDYYLIVETFDPVEEDLPIGILVTGSAGEPIEQLAGDETVEGFFEEGDTDVTYFLDVEEPGTLISLALSSETEDRDFDLEAGIRLDDAIWSTFAIGTDDQMTFVAPAAGRYFVRVVSNDGDGDFSLSVEDQGLAPAVNVNDLTWGSIEEGAENVYRLEISEAGGLLSVALVGQQELDLDLRVAGYDESGNTLAYASGFSVNPAEIVSAPIEEPGLYEVAVSAEFSDGGNYVLLVRLEDPSLLAGQWAADAEASSQFGDDGYSAQQATGAPDTLSAGDFDTAWATENPNDGEQTLELTYEHAVVPGAVNIHENYNPGAVTAVEAYDAENEEWVPLWEGEAGAIEEPMRVFSPELEPVEFATTQLRIVLDTDAVDGWNEIDAVELIGQP